MYWSRKSSDLTMKLMICISFREFGYEVVKLWIVLIFVHQCRYIFVLVIESNTSKILPQNGPFRDTYVTRLFDIDAEKLQDLLLVRDNINSLVHIRFHVLFVEPPQETRYPVAKHVKRRCIS